MPKIPMAEKAGAIRHISDTVHMTGAPNLNWKLDEGQALMDMGDKIGRGAEKLGNAMMAFGQHMQHQEDVLAATEDRNLFHQLNGELNNKLANTPGATDEEKLEWITGYKQKYEDERRPYLQKMSIAFRKQHDAEMNGLRIRAQDDRILLLNQGKVQRVTDQTLAQLKDAALRGDEQEYRRILDNAQQGEYPLFSAEKRAMLEADYSRLADWGEAKRLVEAGTPGIVEMLRARDKDGRYLHFDHLSTEGRERLIHYAETREAHQLSDDYQAAAAETLSTGQFPYTEEQMRQLHEDGAWSDRKFNLMHSLYAAHRKEIDRRESAKKRSVQANRKLRLQAAKNAIDMIDYPAANDYARTRLRMLEQIVKAFPEDFTAQRELGEYLDRRLKNDPLDQSENGRMIKEHIKSAIRQAAKIDDQGMLPKLVELQGQMLHAARNLSAKPDMTYEQIAEQIDQLHCKFLTGEIKSFFNPATGQVRDPGKFGKVFDSRELLKGRSNNIDWKTLFVPADFGMVTALRSFWDPEASPEAEIPRLKAAGWIDKAEVVKAIIDESSGRTIWKLKNGRKVYADEYQEKTDLDEESAAF